MSGKVLIVGSSGPISRALARAYGADAVVVGRGPARGFPFDLEGVEPASELERLPVRVAVFLSAITGFATVESDPTRAYRVNVKQSAEVINGLNARGIPVILVSSSAVFASGATERYESSAANPDSTYGKSKRLLERHILSLRHPLNAIVRLTKVVDGDLEIIQKWCSEAKAGRALVARVNQYLAPIPVSAVIDQLQQVVERAIGGVIHVTSDEGISYYDLARSLFPEATVSAQEGFHNVRDERTSVVLGASRPESNSISLRRCLDIIREDLRSEI